MLSTLMSMATFMFLTTYIPHGYKSGVPMTLSSVHLVYYSGLRKFLLPFINPLKDMMETDDQSDEETHRASSGIVPSAGDSVPMELWSITFWTWIFHQSGIFSKPIFGISIETEVVITERHSALLPFLDNGGLNTPSI